MGNNGKTLIMDPITIKGTGDTRTIKGDTPAAPTIDVNRILVGCIPFTAVSFSGSDSLIAFGRLAGYSLLAYWTWSKMRPVSYGFMSAAGVSLATSLLAGFGRKDTV
jgi:hypothetical protein